MPSDADVDGISERARKKKKRKNKHVRREMQIEEDIFGNYVGVLCVDTHKY